MTMIWVARHPQATPEMLGYLPEMISDEDPRPAREQFDTNYRQGGGWSPFPGFTLMPDDTLEYPGDPPVQVLAETKLRDERILLYEHSWVAIIQPNGTYEICRMD